MDVVVPEPTVAAKKLPSTDSMDGISSSDALNEQSEMNARNQTSCSSSPAAVATTNRRNRRGKRVRIFKALAMITKLLEDSLSPTLVGDDDREEGEEDSSSGPSVALTNSSDQEDEMDNQEAFDLIFGKAGEEAISLIFARLQGK